MTPDNSQPEDAELDRTDKLPVLEDTIADEDMEDDAVPLEQAALPAGSPVIANRTAQIGRAHV